VLESPPDSPAVPSGLLSTPPPTRLHNQFSRSLSSIITRGGRENDFNRQPQLTVWGPNINSILPGKQGAMMTITSKDM
ncbi:hypothetical protein JOQ06_004242, partial [Pogonophryne albipinna]